MNDEIFNNEQESIQRALNEAKKQKLTEKYGANFGEGEPKMSPELESRWLNYIEEFECQFEHTEHVTVRTFVGQPTFKPIDDIAPDRLEAELENVLKFLALHGVVVDFLCDVPTNTAYLFITTELMDIEMDDIHIHGMMTHFTYEEFHPNAEYDAKISAEHFLWDLFDRHEDYAAPAFAEDEVYDRLGNRITREKMKEFILTLYAHYALFTSHEFECLNCTIEGDYATVTAQGSWTGLIAGSMKSVSHTGESILRMKKSPYGGFDLVQANIQGWEY